MSVFSKSLILAIGAVCMVGAANAGAASCVAQQKALGTLGTDITKLQKQRDEVVETFEFHNDERASVESDLSLAKMTGSGDITDLATKYEEHNTGAEEAKLKLDTLNAALMEKADVYNAKIAKFNESCVG